MYYRYILFVLYFLVEMAAMGINSPYMQNPFFQSLSSLLYNQGGGGHPWGPQLSNKAVASMWMNADAKQMQHHEEEEVRLVYLFSSHSKTNKTPDGNLLHCLGQSFIY